MFDSTLFQNKPNNKKCKQGTNKATFFTLILFLYLFLYTSFPVCHSVCFNLKLISLLTYPSTAITPTTPKKKKEKEKLKWSKWPKWPKRYLFHFNPCREKKVHIICWWLSSLNLCFGVLSSVASGRNNHALYFCNTFLLWSSQDIMCLALLIFITSPYLQESMEVMAVF